MALTGKIMDFFEDKAMTVPAFPRTKVKAVSDDNGVGLDALLENIETKVENKQNKHIATTVTLSASGWSNNSQTVSVAGVTATNTVFTTHAPSGYIIYRDCGVRMSAQSAGQLTFVCEAVPTENIIVNIAIFN